MNVINEDLLKYLSQQAKENKRLRKNYNLHDSLDAPVQKLLNALEPNTEVPIHRHTNTSETYILLKGRIKVVFYNNDKEVTSEVILSLRAGNYGVNISKGQWHTVEVLESGTVIFEVKEGPYQPIQEKDILV